MGEETQTYLDNTGQNHYNYFAKMVFVCAPRNFAGAKERNDLNMANMKKEYKMSAERKEELQKLVFVPFANPFRVYELWRDVQAFAKVFAGFGAQLPLMTRILLAFSNFMVAYWPAMLGGLVAAVFAFRAWRATAAGRLVWDGLVLRFPIAGKILHKAALSRFARSFSLGIRSGVPVMQALSNSAQTVDNSYVSRCIEGMRENVERGESLLRASISTGIFTPVVLQMVAVGEESGAVDDMMNEIGDMYRQEVEYELKTLGQQIEPILIVMLGAMVLVLALGIFLPMWDLGKVAIKR